MQHKNDILPNFKYIDTEIGLKFLNNNRELYLKILNNFLERYREFDFSMWSVDASLDGVHTIKGLSATLGMVSLSNVALKLHAGETAYQEAFVRELSCVVEELDMILNNSYPSLALSSILLLNNRRVNIDILLEILELSSCDILIALTIEESIDVIEKEPIDLVIWGLDVTSINNKTLLDKLSEREIPLLYSTNRVKEEKMSDIEDLLYIKSSDKREILTKIENYLK